jgi:DNA repair protein RadC
MLVAITYIVVMKQLRIKDLLDEEKPREKLIDIGAKELTDVELLAIVIGSGNKHYSCIDISRNLLKKYGSLEKVLSTDVHTLKANRDIGLAKSCALNAISEINKRISMPTKTKEIFCKSPDEVYKVARKTFYNSEKEKVALLHLNARNRLIYNEIISVGTLTEALISPREILKSALEKNTASLVLIHNHPSGDTTPSQEDIKITQQLQKICKLSGINFLDHLIVSNNNYTSLKSLGILERR